MKEIRKNKNKIKEEKYMYEFSRSELSAIMTGRGRMLPLKNSFKNSFKGNILCSRYEKETDKEEHLFGKCKLLGDLYVKYNITGPSNLVTCRI